MSDAAQHKVMAAITLIDNHLVDDITREDIAAEACMSLRQCYRAFHHYTGDTMMNYIRIRRLTEASKELVNSPATVLDLAVKYRFKSSEVFSRAFARTFWHTPSQFRAIGSPYIARQRQALDGSQFALVQNACLTQPELVLLPARKVVGISLPQPHYGFQVEGNVSQGLSIEDRLDNYRHRLPNHNGDAYWHVAFLSKPYLQQHIIENLYAFEVSESLDYSLPPPLIYCYLPTCRYARFLHLGTSQTLGYTMSLAFQWLQTSSYYLGDAPSLSRQIRNGGIELLIPISHHFIPRPKWWRGYSPQYLQRLSGTR